MSDLAAEIRRTLTTLCEPRQVIELRILSDKYGVGTNYYADFDALIGDVQKLECNPDSRNYYITFNELDPRVQRRRNKLAWGRNAQPTTSSVDVIKRRWLPIDIDPDVPKETSATDDEKEAARVTAYNTRDYLSAHGFPDPVIGDSGNGYWLFYRVDLPADSESYQAHSKLLKFLDENVEHTGAIIDLTPKNPDRIVKLFGTVARKGTNSEDTPHRQSRLIEIPDNIELLEPETITELIGSVETRDRESADSRKPFDLESWLDERGIKYRVKHDGDVVRYILEVCGFDKSHSRGEATITQFDNGAIAYRCLHNTCKGGERGAWQKYRAMHDADYAERIENDAYFDNYFKGRTLVAKWVADDILKSEHFLTFRDTEEIYRYNVETGLYEEGGDVFVRERTQELLKHRTTNHYINEVEGYIRRSNYVDRSIIEPDLNLIPTGSGVYDLETGAITEYSPKVPFFVRHNGDYDITLLDNADSEAWWFISSIFPDDEIRTVQELAGACLYREYRVKKAFMLIGDGDNGKSLFMNFLRAMLGNRAVSSRTLYQLAADRFATADLYHKNANIQADIGGGLLKNVGTLLTITGDDVVSAQRKNVNAFEFDSYATVIFSTNVLPDVTKVENKKVFFNRWVLIEMPYRFVDGEPEGDNEKVKDADLKAKLLTEDNISWLLTWAIEGLKRLLKQGHYTEGDSTTDVKERWETMTDSLAQFVNNMVEVTRGQRVTKEVFTAEYERYCGDNGLKPVSKTIIGHRLPTLIPETRTITNPPPRSWANINITGLEPQEIEDIGLLDPTATGQKRLSDD